MAAFKCCDQTFFMAVSLMDRYLKLKSINKEKCDLHIIGMTSMFIASKYEDMIPLRIETITVKIGHNKFSCKEIKEYERDILLTLDYLLQIPTPLEFLNRYILELEGNLKDKKELVKKMSTYLLKVITHDYNFCGEKGSKVSISAIYVALKIIEQLKKQRIINKTIIRKLIKISEYSETEILECAKGILKDAQNFDSLFQNLINLKKTHYIDLMKYLSK